MDDLIRRSDVFELLDNWDSEMIVRDSFYCDVEDIPTAQQWIPCSERLPEYMKNVIMQIDNGWIMCGFYEGKRWHSTPDLFDENDGYCIIAWMPLPEPFGE